MKNNAFNYYLSNNTIVFTDTLTKTRPYIAKKPRNHESLFFVTNGALLYQKGNEKTVIKKGHVGYIGRGSVDISSAYLCDSVSYIAVNFSFDHETDLAQETLPFHTLCANDDSHQYEKLFKEALHSFLSRTPGYMALCNSRILNVIGRKSKILHKSKTKSVFSIGIEFYLVITRIGHHHTKIFSKLFSGKIYRAFTSYLVNVFHIFSPIT